MRGAARRRDTTYRNTAMATTTLGVKVDETLRERLKVAAGKLGCTPHWLHKQAVLAYVDAI